MDLHFLEDLLVIFAVGGLIVYLLRLVNVPAMVGLLLAGAAMGPHGLSLVDDIHRVEILAEIGVVLLLFTIGLEFSLEQLARMARAIVGAGGGQMALSVAAVAAATLWQAEELGKAVFFGVLAALSSTAIVLKLLAERAQLGALHGRVAVSILLFQDLCVVPLVLLVPYLAGQGSGRASLLLTILKAGAVVAGVILAARALVPPLLARVVHARSRELFLTAVLVLCLGTAWLTSLAGLSLALGAFLAGLAISESEYSHQAMAEAAPFRDAFGSLFFISIGMLMDASFLLQNLPVVLAVLAAVIAIKTLAGAIPTLLLGYPLPVAAQVGLGLAQVGEFAFVLSREGLKRDLIDPTEYQIFLSASVLTMVITPLLLYLGEIAGQKLPSRAGAAVITSDTPEPLLDHVIIAGYGVNGQNLARALRAAGVPYVVVEMNPETVRNASEQGEPIHYGDGSRMAVLEALGVKAARMYVVAISDAASTRQAVSMARTANPDLFILARTRFVAEIDDLVGLGADEVIPEEFETSVEIFTRVLRRYDVPRNQIYDHVRRVREDMYEMLREPHPGEPLAAGSREPLRGIHVESLHVPPDSPAVGQSLQELHFRARTGASVIAVKRGGAVHQNPHAAFRLMADDVLLVLGDPAMVDETQHIIEPEGA